MRILRGSESTATGRTGACPEAGGRADWWIGLGLLAVFLAGHLPFRTEFAVNWDTVNFALGVERFDLPHHQPHPPGYIGYVLLARLLRPVAGDTHSALTLLSAVAAAIAPVALFVLARRIVPRRHALLAAILLGSSPLLWYYGKVGLTYAVGLAASLPFAWACHRARFDRSERHLVIAAVLLGAIGALRQTDMLLLLPLLGYAAGALSRRARCLAAGALAVTVLAWLIPLLWLSGGLVPYVRDSAALAELVGRGTSVFSLNARGLLQNVGFVAVGLLLGLGGALAVAVHALVARMRPALDREHRRFLLVWVAPSLATYLLLHTGQVGYMLLVLPPTLLVVATGAARSRARAARGGARTRSGAIAACCAAANILVYLAASDGIHAMVRRPDAPVVLVANEVAGQQGWAERTRQYDLRDNDAHWEELLSTLQRFDPDRAAVLALPASGGTFRHLGYYLPEVRVYGLGDDRNGVFGHLFTAYQGRIDYNVETLDAARATLQLPTGVRWLLVPDRDIAVQLSPRLKRRRLELDHGPDLTIVDVQPGSTLGFEGTDETPERSRLVASTGE